MAKQRSNKRATYVSRRKQRSLLKRFGRVHPVVLIIVVAVAIIVARQLSAAENDGANHVTIQTDELMSVKLPAGVAEQIVDYTGFTVSFNADVHQPNYVVWELTKDELNGKESRAGSQFEVDPNVIGSAQLADYRNSGYDRGHMIPAADVKWSEEAMRESHLLTNICPQAHKLNAGAWATLEGNCRQWAARDSAIIIICGPVLCDRMPRAIGTDGRRIPVPERFFKVVLSPYSNPPRGIGFLMANGAVSGGVQAAAVSIDEVEAVTGYDFFAALPDDIESEVESQCAYHEWQRKKR